MISLKIKRTETNEISKDDARNIVEDNNPEWKTIERIVVEQARWRVLYRLILQHNDKFYSVHANFPATEMQECDLFIDDRVEFCEVHKVETTVLSWEAV